MFVYCIVLNINALDRYVVSAAVYLPVMWSHLQYSCPLRGLTCSIPKGYTDVREKTLNIKIVSQVKGVRSSSASEPVAKASYAYDGNSTSSPMSAAP